MPKIRAMNTTEKIITALGGTNAVASECKIKPPSVSEWIANDKIPNARRQFLELKYPAVFAGVDSSEAQKQVA